MNSLTAQERRLTAGALGLLGLTLSACGVVATLVAIEHMARDAGVCGPLNGHCGWCYGAAGMGIAALAVLALAVRLGWSKDRASARGA